MTQGSDPEEVLAEHLIDAYDLSDKGLALIDSVRPDGFTFAQMPVEATVYRLYLTATSTFRSGLCWALLAFMWIKAPFHRVTSSQSVHTLASLSLLALHGVVAVRTGND